MKKAIFIFIIIILTTAVVYADSESWMSLGFESGHFFEHASDSTYTANSYMSSPGIAFSGYTFWNDKNVGLFIHDSFLFPQKMSSDITGKTEDIDLDIYDFFVQVGIIFGPGFKYDFSEQLKLHYGIGLSILETAAKYSKDYQYYGNVSFSMLAFNFGLGGDIGIKYDITDSFYLDLGSIINYDFKNHTSIQSSYGDSSAWSNSNYRMISFRPYFCLGLNFYKTNEGLGKKQ